MDGRGTEKITRRWGEEHFKREETAGASEIADSRPSRAARGEIDYVLRVRVTAAAQPIAVACIEAKRENALSTAGLGQVRRD